MIHRWQRRIARVVLLTFGTSLAACGGADEAPPTTTSTVAPTPTAPAPTLPVQPPEQLSQQQLRELVAPVALYPDVVLASLIPATTYPDQIADAAQYVAQQNGQVQAVPEDRSWDGSVAGLLQFPDVLTWLDQNDDWTNQMGTAVTYQQGEVLQAVQDYRQEAMDAGNLKSNEYMTVRQDEDQEVRIDPAKPDTVYVPQYDPVAVTQPQEKTGINPWLAFGGGAAVGALGAWALYSIFDDDDDDDHHGGGNKKVIKTYNNYYYGGGGGGGPRPRPTAWQARPAQQPYRRSGTVQRPTPYRPVYASKPSQRAGGGQQGGVRPPQRRPAFGAGEPAGQRRPGGVARPVPAPGMGGGQQRREERRNEQVSKPTPAQRPGAEPKQKKQQGGGGGQAKPQQQPQVRPAPAGKKEQKQAQQAPQPNKNKKKKKKQGGGGN